MRLQSNEHNDKVNRIQKNIKDAKENIESAEETAYITENPNTKKDIKDKNARRRTAIYGMENEIKDESVNRKDFE